MAYYLSMCWVERFRVQRSGLKAARQLESNGFCLHQVYKAISPKEVCRVVQILINIVSCALGCNLRT
jgi:hypothetical protein